MAFKPSLSLQARTEARLRGWRNPPILVLRQEKKRTNPIALDPAFRHVPQWETRKGLPAEQAYKMMGLPMGEVMARRGSSRRDVERADVMQTARQPTPRDEPQEVEALELSIARAMQKRPSAEPFRPLEDRRISSVRAKANPMRYKPPATSYWRHSIYAYNKNSTKYLPATTANTNKLIRAYFNMVPKHAPMPTDPVTPSKEAGAAGIAPADKLISTESAAGDSSDTGNTDPLVKRNPELRKKQEQDNRRKLEEHKTHGSRIYVSDRGYRSKGHLRQDIIGKITPRMNLKASFHYPFQDIQNASPQITYKHYRDGVGISVHVHESVEETTTYRKKQSGTEKRKKNTPQVE